MDEERVDGRALRYQHRRPELLSDAAEYVLEHGIGELSLRPMALALGVTHATLIRHFSSKDQLLVEIVEELCRSVEAQVSVDAELTGVGSTSELVRAFWRRLDDPRERRQFVLLAEIYGLALRDPGRYAAVLQSTADGYLTLIETMLARDGFAPPRARVIATALLAQLRGLQLDLAATGDRDRIEQAFAATIDALLPSASSATG